MKKYFFVGEFPHYLETFVLNQIVSMIKWGYDVRVLSIRRNHEVMLHDENDDQDILGKSDYLLVKMSGHVNIKYSCNQL